MSYPQYYWLAKRTWTWIPCADFYKAHDIAAIQDLMSSLISMVVLSIVLTVAHMTFTKDPRQDGAVRTEHACSTLILRRNVMQHSSSLSECNGFNKTFRNNSAFLEYDLPQTSTLTFQISTVKVVFLETYVRPRELALATSVCPSRRATPTETCNQVSTQRRQP